MQPEIGRPEGGFHADFLNPGFVGAAVLLEDPLEMGVSVRDECDWVDAGWEVDVVACSHVLSS
jgi:hypothetical protein